MLAALEQEFADARAGVENARSAETAPDAFALTATNQDRPRTARQQSLHQPRESQKKEGRAARGRTHVGEETRRDIISVAMQEFAEKGLRGARKRRHCRAHPDDEADDLLPFRQQGKPYATVMEEAYGEVRSKEQGLHLDSLPPEKAMQRLVEVTFDHHAAHPEHVRLVCVENMERARHISGRPSMLQRNAIAIETVRALLERGEREGVFLSGHQPVAPALVDDILLLHPGIQPLHVERRIRYGPMGGGKRPFATRTDRRRRFALRQTRTLTEAL